MKRTLVWLICLALVFTLFTVAAVAEEKITLTVAVPDVLVVEDWETNAMTRYLEEQLNCNLDFVKFPADAGEYKQKIELAMLDGSDLPDVIITSYKLNLVQLQQYAQLGRIVALNEYVENDMPLLDQRLSELVANPITKEQYKMYLTSPDGNIYALGRAMATVNNSLAAGRSEVYLPWLEAYLEYAGLEELTTVEEFRDMLIYFRDNDMNGNGIADDEIPYMTNSANVMSSLYRQLMNPFVYSQDHYLSNEDGTIVFTPATEGFKAGCEFVRSLVEEGLISTLSFTQDNTSFNAIVTAEPTTVGVIGRMSSSNFAATDPRRAQYAPIGALEGPEGLCQCAQVPNIPEAFFMVTSKCPDVELAIRFGDQLSGTKLTIWNRYGIEGENWIHLTGDEVGVSEYSSLGFVGEYKEINNIWGVSQNTHWFQTGPTIMDGSELTLKLAIENTEGKYSHTMPIGANIARELDYVNKENAVFGLIYTESEQEVINEFQSVIESYVSEMFSSFVTGTKDIDEYWDTYLSELNAMGLEKYLETVQSAWTRMNG